MEGETGTKILDAIDSWTGPIAPASSTPEPQELCKICGERPADHPVRYGWCKACVSRTLHEARKLKSKLEPPLILPPMAPAESPKTTEPADILTTGPFAIIVDFEHHRDLLKLLVEKAQDEIRTTAQQIIYLVKAHLKGR